MTQVTAPGNATTTYAHTVTNGRITRTVVRDALAHETTYAMYAGEDPLYIAPGMGVDHYRRPYRRSEADPRG